MDRLTDLITSARDWLDARGRPAWITAMILGFIFVWPLGLFLLFYMIWSKRMKCHHKNARSIRRPTGNAAFDAYKAETLQRLEDEQTAFEGFLQRLRETKDKNEFDQFMADRSRPADPA